MRKERSLVGTAVCAMIVLTAGVMVGSADQVKGRWRIDLQVGNVNPGGRIDSDAGATQVLLQEPLDAIFVTDPRPLEDQGTYANSRGRGRIELHASYGLIERKSSEIVLDFGLGYYRQVIRGLELSSSFDAIDPDYNRVPGCETRIARAGGTIDSNQLNGCTWFGDSNSTSIYPGPFNAPTRREFPDTPASALGYQLFKTEKMEGGTLSIIPLSMDVLFRYRPTKRFNPYIGGGVGYLLVRLDESERFRQFADQMAGSLVAQVVGPLSADPSAIGDRGLDPNEVQIQRVITEDGRDLVTATKLGHRMIRPSIDAPNTFFFQARAGVELQLSPRWSAFAESKFFWARKNIRITADGQTDFGRRMQSITTDLYAGGGLNPAAFPEGGLPVYVIDGGLHQPVLALDSTTEIQDDGSAGLPGEYYFRGGELKYGGFVFTIGLRLTL